MGRYAGLARARQINAANELQLLGQQMNLARERERRGLQGLAMQRQAWQDQRAAEQDAFNRNRMMEQDRIAAEDRAWGRQVQQFGLDSQQMRNAMAMDEWQRGRQQYSEDRMKRLRDEGLADVLREAAVAGSATPETLMRVNGAGALKFAAAEFDPEQGVVNVKFADGSVRPFQPWEVSQIAGMPQAPAGPSVSDMTSRARTMIQFANTQQERAQQMMEQAAVLRAEGYRGFNDEALLRKAQELEEDAQNILNTLRTDDGDGIFDQAQAILTGGGLNAMARGAGGGAGGNAAGAEDTSVEGARQGITDILGDAQAEADANAKKARKDGDELARIGEESTPYLGQRVARGLKGAASSLRNEWFPDVLTVGSAFANPGALMNRALETAATAGPLRGAVRAAGQFGDSFSREMLGMEQRPLPTMFERYSAMSPEEQQAVIAAAAKLARQRGIPAREAFEAVISQGAQ